MKPGADRGASVLVCWAILLQLALVAAQVPTGSATAPSDAAASTLVQTLLGATTPEARSAKVLELQTQLTPAIATALRRETKVRCQRGDLAGAQAAADTAVAVAGVLNDLAAQGEGHLASGLVLAKRGDHTGSIARYEQALRLAISSKDASHEQALTPSLSHPMGEGARRAGEGDSQPFMAGEQDRKEQGPRLELEARTQLGRSCLHTGEFDRAIAEFSRCLAAGEAANDRAVQADALHNLGEAFRQRGQLQDALTHFRAALERMPPAPDGIETADTRMGIAGVLLDLGEPEKALDEYRAVLAIYRKAADAEGEGIVLGNMGVAWEMTARYEEALRHYEQSLAIKTRIGDNPGRVTTLNNLGVLWLMAGDHETALDFFQQSLDLAEQTADFAGKARALNNRGETLLQMGRFLEAFRALEQSLNLYRQAGDNVSVAEVQGGIATLKKALGDDRGALADFRAILPVFEADGRKHDVAITLHNLGGILQSLGRRREALELLEASLKLRQELGDRQGQAVTRNALGEVALDAGDLEAARGHYTEAFAIAHDIGARIEEVRALLGLGAVELRLDRRPEALRRGREAQAAAAPLADVALQVEVWQRLGDVHRAEANWADAAAAYRQAVGRIEALRFAISGASHRVSFLEQYAPAYQRLALCLVRLGRASEAWQTVEACRARALAEVLVEGRHDPREGLTAEERRHLRELEQRVRLARLEQSTLESQAPVEPARLKEVAGRLAPAMEALEAFEKELQLKHPRSASASALALPFGPTGSPPIPGVLAADESVVFLEYVVVEERTLLFVLTADTAARGAMETSPAVFEVEVTAAELTTLVRNLRNRLENRWLSLPLPESRRLYDLLIAPAQPLLAGAGLVCIVPDAILWEVPFQALCTASGRYLIQDHALTYAPSLHALAALDDRQTRRDAAAAGRQPQDRTLLVMANPDLGPAARAANPLLGAPVAIPGTEEQGRQIAAMFGERTRLCVGADATEPRARELAPQYHVLHFATHGVFEPASPMFSGVRLAPGAEQDGYWEAREILQTGLNTELVVLSACETARGQLRQGEGLWGLSWALLTAGSRANLLSQWAVADQSTAELMTAFYRHWRNTDGGGGGSRITKAEALRRAQLELLEGRSAGGRKHAHPFHWAPFILIGDWR